MLAVTARDQDQVGRISMTRPPRQRAANKNITSAGQLNARCRKPTKSNLRHRDVTECLATSVAKERKTCMPKNPTNRVGLSTDWFLNGWLLCPRLRRKSMQKCQAKSTGLLRCTGLIKQKRNLVNSHGLVTSSGGGLSGGSLQKETKHVTLVS